MQSQLVNYSSALKRIQEKIGKQVAEEQVIETLQQSFERMQNKVQKLEKLQQNKQQQQQVSESRLEALRLRLNQSLQRCEQRKEFMRKSITARLRSKHKRSNSTSMQEEPLIEEMHRESISTTTKPRRELKLSENIPLQRKCVMDEQDSIKYETLSRTLNQSLETAAERHQTYLTTIRQRIRSQAERITDKQTKANQLESLQTSHKFNSLMVKLTSLSARQQYRQKQYYEGHKLKAQQVALKQKQLIEKQEQLEEQKTQRLSFWQSKKCQVRNTPNMHPYNQHSPISARRQELEKQREEVMEQLRLKQQRIKNQNMMNGILMTELKEANHYLNYKINQSYF